MKKMLKVGSKGNEGEERYRV